MKQTDDEVLETGWLLSFTAPWQEHAKAVLMCPPRGICGTSSLAMHLGLSQAPFSWHKEKVGPQAGKGNLRV